MSLAIIAFLELMLLEAALPRTVAKSWAFSEYRLVAT